MRRTKVKKGAASFYIVAFTTLVLMIIATSFAAVIISEVTRTSNDDLSQSAYDSAMAGVEDAKLAFYSYQNCVAQGAKAVNKPVADGQVTCEEIVYYMEHPDCDMVGRILNRESDNVKTEENVKGQIQEGGSTDNNMQQAYTCVEMRTSLNDYRSTLSASDMLRVAKVKFDGVATNDIKKVKISWYSDTGSKLDYKNLSGSEVTFGSALNGVSVPPTISLAMIQTGCRINNDACTFKMSDFDVRQGNSTNRGMIYLVPTSDKTKASASNKSTYKGSSYDDNNKTNRIGTEAFLKSNDKTAKNLPYAVYCDRSAGTEFLCSATIDLPNPVGEMRSEETFAFVVGLPYGKPTTDFSLEFYCADNRQCGREITADGKQTTETSQANLENVQVQIDSTGRANDLFRRVETRLENEDDYALSILGPLELMGTGGGFALDKDYTVLTEWNFQD